MQKSLFKIFFPLLLICTPMQLIAEDNSALLKRLELLEKELSEIKAKLKVNSHSNIESNQASSSDSKKIDEELFKPQVANNSIQTSQDNNKISEEEAKRIKELGQFGITYRSDGFTVNAMRFGAYGESIFGRQNAGNGWKNGFDANRVVLLGTYPVTPNIIFNTEIEFEHGGIAKDADDKLDGAIEVEQVFVDFMIDDHFTWRSPGVDVVPVGYVGLFHEPTQFYSTSRPEIYQGIIPATWFAPSTGAYGKIIDGLNYQFQVSSGLEDVGAVADEEGGSVLPGGYSAGISGTEALGLARAPIGDRSQLGSNLASTLRLSYSPSSIAGLSGSTSYYYTNDTSPRGAYGTFANGAERKLGKSDLSILDSEIRYRVPTTGIELRAEVARIDFGNTDNLRANNDGDPTNNVGNSMNAYSLETSYHYNISKSAVHSWELVPFYRYSYIEYQTGGVRGSDDDTPTGEGKKHYNTVGAALFPTPKVVLKVDYQMVHDDYKLSSNQSAFMGAVGFFF